MCSQEAKCAVEEGKCEVEAQWRRGIDRTLTGSLGATPGRYGSSFGGSSLQPIGALVGRVTRTPARLGLDTTLMLTAFFATGVLAITDPRVWPEHLPAHAASLLGEHAGACPGYGEEHSSLSTRGPGLAVGSPQGWLNSGEYRWLIFDER